MKLFKRVGAMVLAIAMVLTLIPDTVFAVDGTNFMLSATPVDGSVGGTSTVTFCADVDINLTGIDGILFKEAKQEGGEGKLYIASMIGKTGLGFTTVEIDTEGNGYLAGAWADAPKAVAAGEAIFTATYTVPAGTAPGLYKVELSFDYPGWLETDGGSSNGGFETERSYFAYIEVTEPEAVPAFELYYEFNSNVDADSDKYIDFAAGETVTATIYAKAATPTKLQAFDLYVTNDALLEYKSYDSEYGVRIGSSAGEGKASTDTLQHIQFEFIEGSTTEIAINETGTELASITFKISEDAVYSNDQIGDGWIGLAITDESNLATEYNEKSINTSRDDDDPYLLTISAPVLGAEVTSIYTVTYDDNVDDTSVTNMPDPISVDKNHNREITLSQVVPIRNGFAFMGWTKTQGKVYTSDADVDYAPGAIFNENADITLYALWKQNTYTVQWFNNHADPALLELDENVIHGSVADYNGEEPVKAPTGSKIYTFVGWNEDPDASTGILEADLPNVTADVSYYAIFSESDRVHTVYWMSQDGNTELSNSSVIYDNPPVYQNGFAEPTKDEDANYTYTFAGWATQPNQTTGTALEDLPNVTDEVYYYAAFSATPKTFTVTLVPNGGIIADGYNVTGYTYGVGAALPGASNITLSGYVFGGWYTDETFAEGTGPVDAITDTDSGNKTYYAKWEEKTYNVQYNPGIGTGNVYTDSGIRYEHDSYTIKAYNDEALGFVAPEGYAFAGWSASNGEVYNTGSSYTKMTDVDGETIVLTAIWAQDVYDITYVFTDGTDSLTDVSNGNPDTYSKSSGLTLVAPTKTGYTFTGWTAVYTDDNTEFVLTNGTTIPVNSEGKLTITGTFTKETYTITYNANGGSVAVDTQDYTITSVDDLAIPTRNGYTFAGWTNAGSTVGSWEANETTNPAGQKLNKDWGNVTLTAQWTQTEYTITFTGMSGANTTATYRIEETATIAAKKSNPSKAHYVFNGWIPNDAGNWGATMIAASDTATTTVTGKYGDVTLTANWTPIEYTITFYTNPAGADPNPILKTVTFNADNTSIEVPEVPSKAGHAGAWSSYSVDPSAGDQNVYPVYTPIEYTITYDANGGTVTPTSQGYSVKSSITLATPTRVGYTFAGWLVTSESSGSWLKGENKPTSYTLNNDWGNVTLQAQWTAIKYSINFVTDGEAIPVMEYTIEDTTALPAATGNGLYIFQHWRLTAAVGDHNWGDVKDDSAEPAVPGTIFTTNNTVEGHYGNITLTAEWDVSFTYKVEEYKYAYTGWKMLLIDATDAADGATYTFDGVAMFYTTDANYLIETDDTGVFYTLVPAAYLDGFELNRTGVGKVATSNEDASVLYGDGELKGDINGDGKVNIADANIIHQMVERGGGYYGEDQLSTLARLRCDIDTDSSGSSDEFRGSINDTNAVVNLINKIQ